MSLFSRIRQALSLRDLVERRNITALAARLGISRADAAWIVRRSREVGYPQARTEFDAYARSPRPAVEVSVGSVDQKGLAARATAAPDERGP